MKLRKFSGVFTRLAVWRRKRETVRVYVFERADFTDPSHVTRLLYTDLLTRNEFVDRPEVFRGNLDKSGSGDKEGFIALQTGKDVVTPNELLRGRESKSAILFELADEDVLFDVADGKYVPDFRSAEDYYHLPADVSTFDSSTAIDRRFWYDKVVATAQADKALGRNRFLEFIKRNWGLLFFVCATTISILLLMYR